MVNSIYKNARRIISAVHTTIIRSTPELRKIRKIIQDPQRRPSSTGLVAQRNDQVFIRRLQTNPVALRMSFWENHFELKSLSSYPEISGRILDFGCGSGHLDILLARSGKSIHGIDMSTIGINIANALRSEENEAVQSRLSFAVVDITRELPKVAKFDSAWSAHVFEHIADPGPIFAGLKNWLKSGAYILISVPLGHAYDDPDHVNHFFHVEELRSFLAGHIRVIKIDTSYEYEVMRALCRLD